MGGFIGVYSIEPATDSLGPEFDPALVAAFVARWALAPVGDGEYLAPEDEFGYQSEMSVGTDGLSISRPTEADVDRAIDFMVTVGGTLAGSISPFISTDTRWLAVPPDDQRRIFVVADATGARNAFDAVDSPPGVWDVRAGFDAVPIVVPRPMADYSPELRWNGWLVMFHADEIEVQVVPDHGFWGVPLRNVEADRTYRANGWNVRQVDDALVVQRPDRTVRITESAGSPVVSESE
ncbi:hypothetical protein [Tsukamurella strandjordii]|uniref:Uncharacterized protein n=1 Tax=Tsukamurella strandjordii TaxID=147577 RepID=A0AA90SKX7_9ACTN|nr:hypothetical protein [Tsukamurella strandjordii]MDP0397597.1 hypothetical protein [Tsukamurella strandjordii]